MAQFYTFSNLFNFFVSFVSDHYNEYQMKKKSILNQEKIQPQHTVLCKDSLITKILVLHLTADRLAQLRARWTSVREVASSNLRPDQHLGSLK